MRVPRMAIGLILTALLVNCATGAPRGSRGWEFLGKRDVDFRVDHDSIEVGRAEGRFSELRFVVQGGNVEMYDVKVVLGDGDAFSPGTRLVFERGEGRIIRLPGEHRIVRRVEFVYRSLRGRGRHATVTLFGR